MKKIILLAMTILSQNTFATSKLYDCRARILENSVEENFQFKFKCDSGGNNTFKSKSGRIAVVAYSDESCVPQLVIYDEEARTGVISAAVSKQSGQSFTVFESRLVVVYYKSGVSLADLMNREAPYEASVVCSDDATLLSDGP